MRNSILVMLVVFGSAIASLKRQFVGFITISWFRRQATSADQLDQEKRTAREPLTQRPGSGGLPAGCPSPVFAGLPPP